MNRRTESRFQVRSQVHLTLLDQAERELTASLADVSGAGFQLLADEELPARSMLMVETDAHLILAEVRNSRRRGGRFAIGAQRVHTISKLDLADGAAGVEKVQQLIQDYQLTLRKESAVPSRVPTPVASPVSAPEPGPVVEPQAMETQTASEDDGREDVFEPRPSAIFHAIPQVARPALPKLAVTPSSLRV